MGAGGSGVYTETVAAAIPEAYLTFSSIVVEVCRIKPMLIVICRFTTHDGVYWTRILCPEYVATKNKGEDNK